jgi:nucleotide-binding universal stress UspA family protein
MPYKTIVVHLDNSKACDQRVGVALTLAAREDAHLVGLYLGMEVSIPGFVIAQMPPETRELQHRSLKQEAVKARTKFEQAAKRAGLNVEVRQEFATAENMSEILALHARYADLLILSQFDPDSERGLPDYVLEDTLLTAGRPVLVIPYIGAGKNFGRRVMVAWDAGREAARAVRDAMPLLQAAETVTIVAVNAKSGIGDHGDEPGADIALMLARHGVKAEAEHLVSREVSTSDSLLSRLSDKNADLLVMGAYGHPRLREVILGGVTRHLLEHMTVPVLMSH